MTGREREREREGQTDRQRQYEAKRRLKGRPILPTKKRIIAQELTAGIHIRVLPRKQN